MDKLEENFIHINLGTMKRLWSMKEEQSSQEVKEGHTWKKIYRRKQK